MTTGSEQALHFEKYSKYYDLLYGDKDYAGEIDFVLRVTREFLKSNPESALDLGCGTGRHAACLSEKGIRVQGVDASETMLKMARRRLLQLSETHASRMDFVSGDFRSVRLTRKFDLVVSLFHVLSYQTTNDDVIQALTTIHRHLKPGGVAFFDFWHGPAVLAEGPTARTKEWNGKDLRVSRRAAPELKISENKVDVAYQIQIETVESGEKEEIVELHSMRYFFKPELEMFLKLSGLELLEWGHHGSRAAPTAKDWEAYCVVRAATEGPVV